MIRDNLEEVTYKIVAERIVEIMHLHLLRHHKGLHARIVNGSFIATKPMEMDVNVDGMGRIFQSSTPSSLKALVCFQLPYLILIPSGPKLLIQSVVGGHLLRLLSDQMSLLILLIRSWHFLEGILTQSRRRKPRLQGSPRQSLTLILLRVSSSWPRSGWI